MPREPSSSRTRRYNFAQTLARVAASNTHSCRWFAATRTASHVSIADRLGLPLAVARATGCRIAYLADPTMRRIADLEPRHILT
ncbi:hypothetical protein OHV05_38155 (plasmid) [Kitasatospora sp. NBC_00070]